jgi:hypothetical protein
MACVSVKDWVDYGTWFVLCDADVTHRPRLSYRLNSEAELHKSPTFIPILHDVAQIHTRRSKSHKSPKLTQVAQTYTSRLDSHISKEQDCFLTFSFISSSPGFKSKNCPLFSCADAIARLADPPS